MPQNTGQNSGQKTVSEKIQHICNIILALGAIAAVITGVAAWLRPETTQPSVANPTAPNVTVDNSNQIENSNEGAEATAENAPINIENQSRNDAPQATASSSVQLQSPAGSPVDTVTPTQNISNTPSIHLSGTQSSSNFVADQSGQQTKQNQVKPESDESIPTEVTNSQTMTDSPGGIQIQDSSGVNVTTGDTTINNTENNNAPNCVGGIGNACASDSTVNNNMNGATIDNRSTMP